MKLLEESTGQKLQILNLVMISWIWHRQGTGKKMKNKTTGLCENEKLLLIKRHDQQGEKATHRMGDNVYKLGI